MRFLTSPHSKSLRAGTYAFRPFSPWEKVGMRGSKRKFLHFIPLTLTFSLREKEPKALLRKFCEFDLTNGNDPGGR